MAAKLTFNDLENKQLDSSKILFTGSNENNALSKSSGAPTNDAVTGAIYVDTSTGRSYIKTAAGASGNSWTRHTSGSLTENVENLTYKSISINNIVTSAATSAPVVGDLVGIWGAGAWATSGALSQTKQASSGFGTKEAAMITGGLAGATFFTRTATFNGSAWTTIANLNLGKAYMASCGNQFGAMVMGGNGSGGNVSNTELFNGSTWTFGASTLSISNNNYASPCATSFASTLVAGGNNGGTVLSRTEIFNGSAWYIGTNLVQPAADHCACGSFNASLIAGGADSTGGVVTSTQVFNGTSWAMDGFLTGSREDFTGAGHQYSTLVTTGLDASSNYLSSTEVFNGSTWTSLSANTSQSKQFTTGCGSQSSAWTAGGRGGATTFSTTELYSQTTYRKMYASKLPTAANIGILTSASTVQLMGNIPLSGYYPANKYLVLNRNAICAAGNEANITVGYSLSSIQGSGPNFTLNFSSTSVTQVCPGMIAIVSSGGANPISGGNIGAFVISRVVPSSSIDVYNPSGSAQNPGTGSITILSSMLAIDTPTPDDIIIGKTDSSGNLRISKPVTPSSIGKRLK